MSDTFLAHHGVKNQKWGVRQYQNADGSLTPLGRIHYGVGAARNKAKQSVGKIKTAARKKFKPTTAELNAQIRKQKAKNLNREKREELKQLKKTGKNEPSTKDPDGKTDRGQHRRFSELSDKEINDRINRLRKEIELADLERTKNYGPTQRMVDRAIRSGVEKGIGNITNAAVTKVGKQILDGVLDGSNSSSNNQSKSEDKSKSSSRLDDQVKKSEQRAKNAKKKETIASNRLKAQQSRQKEQETKQKMKDEKRKSRTRTTTQKPKEAKESSVKANVYRTWDAS